MIKVVDPSIIIPLSYYEDLKGLVNSTLENTWISPKLKLPPEDEKVILLTENKWPDGSWSIFHYIGRLVCLKNGKKYFSSKCKIHLNEVKYWMHIPDPPK